MSLVNLIVKSAAGRRGLAVVLLFALSAGPEPASGQSAEKPNVLFIALDDLKPLLGCYGDTLAITPNIDRLAGRGTVFLQNYCQQAVCGPTRASLMTGRRPDYTKVWDLQTRMRDINPDILSIPQHFISQGYSTQGIGKIYDPRCVDKKQDAPSWSVPYYRDVQEYFAAVTGPPELNYYQLPETKVLMKKYRAEGEAKGLKGQQLNTYIQDHVKPSVECIDVPDNAYIDGANTLKAKEILIELKKKNAPFFFAVGFAKPHLPFTAPKKYWDMYQREKIPLAAFQQQAESSPALAYHKAGELYRYTDIPPVAHSSRQKVGLTLPPGKQRELVHGYYAAVSYVDAQVGILLDALDSLGMSKNTIVVLWGDHGWHLGDHNLWCKHTNFEQATRAPLLIAAPGIKPSVTHSPSEFVDVFPTLCDLARIPTPSHLDGVSLTPLMKNPAYSVKDFSVSQYPRSGSREVTGKLGWSAGEIMGYSLRTAQYRYTVWLKGKFRSNIPYRKELVVARELYDYSNDPDETVNVVDNKEYLTVAEDMDKKMLLFLESQVTKN